MDPAALPAEEAGAGESLAAALARIDTEFAGAYRLALAAERIARIDAFTALPPVICGMRLVPLNLWHVNALLGVGNPFLSGGARTPAAAAALLWLLSPDYAPQARWARGRFLRRVRRLGWAELLAALEDYLEGIFAESELPTVAAEAGGRAGTHGPLWSLAASMVHVFGRAYGWTRAQTMAEPLEVLFQLRRLIHAENNPDAPLFNARSGAVRAARNRAREACRRRFAAGAVPVA